MYMPNGREELGEIGPSRQSSHHLHERENHAYQFNAKKKAQGVSAENWQLCLALNTIIRP
jgi:hypothetical protein